jgi:hypothetical protein
MIPAAIFELITKALQKAAERPDVDIPPDRKEIVAQQVVRQARNLPEIQELEEASAP